MKPHNEGNPPALPEKLDSFANNLCYLTNCVKVYIAINTIRNVEF